MHQQSREESVNQQDVSLGTAAQRLLDGDEPDQDASAVQRVWKRLAIVAQADDVEELAYRLRQFISLLRARDIGLDYGRLAADLYKFQFRDGADRVRLRWGQDFFGRLKIADTDDEMEELSRLEFGIRVDQEGQLLRDFHMVHAYKNRQDFRTEGKQQYAYITERYYLADAVFLAGVSTDDVGLLDQLEEAVAYPAFPLYLGRRSCPPSLPILLGRRDCSLREALQQEPWQAAEWYRKRFPQGQPPSEALPLFHNRMQDTLALARRKVSNVPNYHLETLAAHFSIPLSRPHRALPDCYITQALLTKLNEI